MRIRVICLAATAACGPARGEPRPSALTAAARPGELTGTAFWLGELPTRDGNGLFDIGEAHEDDWTGPPDAYYEALADVTVLVTPIDAPSNWHVGSELDFPQDEGLVCDNRCTGLTVVRGDELVITNYRDEPLVLDVSRQGVVVRTLAVPADTQDAIVSIADLDHGVFELTARDGERAWLRHEPAGTAIVGGTNGNCRFSMSLMPGRYHVVAWNPALLPIEQDIEIHDNQYELFDPIFSTANLPPEP